MHLHVIYQFNFGKRGVDFKIGVLPCLKAVACLVSGVKNASLKSPKVRRIWEVRANISIRYHPTFGGPRNSKLIPETGASYKGIVLADHELAAPKSYWPQSCLVSYCRDGMTAICP